MKRAIRPVCELVEIVDVDCGVALMPVMVRRRAPAGRAYHEKAIRDGRDRQAKPVRLREL